MHKAKHVPNRLHKKGEGPQITLKEIGYWAAVIILVIVIIKFGLI